MTMDEQLRRFIRDTLPKRRGVIVSVGPVVWQPVPDVVELRKTDPLPGWEGAINLELDHAKRWYLVVVSGETGARIFHIDTIDMNNDREGLEQARALLLTLLRQRKPSVVVKEWDDELQMARFTEATWPSERATRVRSSLEQERAAW
jgi:hypothetical protein